MTNEETREHMDMLIAHKDKALETHPYFKRCDSCIHSEEQDGSNCYECVKGMADNFEAQPCEDCISRSELLRHQHIIYDDDEEGYNVVYVKDIKAMPPVTPTSEDIKEAYLKGYDYGVKDWFKSKTQPCEDYNWKALWHQVKKERDIAISQLHELGYEFGEKIEPCEDCISREEVRRILGNEVFELTKLHTVNPEDNPKADAMAYGVNWSLNTLMELPSVTPKGVTVTDFADRCRECGRIKPSEDAVSREAVKNGMIKYGFHAPDMTVTEFVEDCLPPVTPKYTDEEIDRAQAVEQAYVDKMVELAVEETKRPKGKWIEVDVHNFYATLKCSVCDRVIEPYFTFGEYSYEDIKTFYPYCHCGAEMSGGGECNSMAVKSED